MKTSYLLLFLIPVFLLYGCAAGKRARSKEINAIIETARSYTGTPYKDGGLNRSGLDCSGLIYVSYRSAGLNLPRTTKELSNFGKRISMQKLRPGDILFFSKKKGRRKVAHAGLVTEIRGRRSVRFIHASTRLGVVESELYTDYYQSIFVKARRPKF